VNFLLIRLDFVLSGTFAAELPCAAARGQRAQANQ
jgi:hypothetical protein